jgi:collagenase-like PrtC family protease
MKFRKMNEVNKIDIMNNGIGLSVPANFSDTFIIGLEKLVTNKRGGNYIDNVYGSPRYLLLGQARASTKIPNLSHSELKEYVDSLHQIGVKFHFTLNSVWSNGVERNSELAESVFSELSSIIETGVDALIIGNLYLASFVKKHFKDIKTICSINLKTDSTYKIEKMLSDFYFDKIVLDRCINRNITFLRNIEKKYNDRIVLLANPDCLMDCPLSLYHMLENGQKSMTDISYTDENYCVNYCQSKYLENYAEILKNSWIHPSDIDLYKNIGVKFLKIQGRTLPEQKILELTELYLNEANTDNLLEIFPNFLNNKKQAEKFKIFNDHSFDRRAFIESFFNNEIICKNECGVKCFKCDKLISVLQNNIV